MAVQWRREIDAFKGLEIDHGRVSIWDTGFRGTMEELTRVLGEPGGSRRFGIVDGILRDLNGFVEGVRKGEGEGEGEG